MQVTWKSELVVDIQAFAGDMCLRNPTAKQALQEAIWREGTVVNAIAMHGRIGSRSVEREQDETEDRVKATSMV